MIRAFGIYIISEEIGILSEKSKLKFIVFVPRDMNPQIMDDNYSFFINMSSRNISSIDIQFLHAVLFFSKPKTSFRVPEPPVSGI